MSISEWINNDSNINILHHYKNIYEISKFNPHEPILTVAKKNILEASRGQVFLILVQRKSLDEQSRLSAFQYDIVNTRSILLQIRRDEDSRRLASAYKRIFENLTENAIQLVRTINAKPIKNGQPVRLQGGQGRKDSGPLKSKILDRFR